MSKPVRTPPAVERPSSRGRWARVFVAALVLGALSNYAVAWLLILRAPAGALTSINSGAARETSPDFTFVADEVVHEVTVDDMALGVRCAVWVIPDSSGENVREPKPLDNPPAWMVVPAKLHHGDGTDGQGSSSITWTNAYGFPAISLMCTEGMLYDKAGAARLWQQARWSFDVEAGDRRYRLPLMPVWKGFMLNAAFYGALWIGVLLALARMASVAGAVWAWVERRIDANTRGKCRKCGYSRAGLLKENAPCPECGHRPF